MSSPPAATGRSAPGQINLSALPAPALLVERDGRIAASNARARALGLGDRVPESWLRAGPLATLWRTGDPAEGAVPGWRTGHVPVHWGVSAVDGAALCLQTAAPLQAENRDRLRFLDEVVDLSRVGGWELDLETMTPMWSDRTCDIHEEPRGTVPDLDTAIEYYAPEARPKVLAAIERGIATGEEWDQELPFITARGRHIWVRTRGRPIFENGRCVRLLGTFEDITARVEAAAETRRALQASHIFAELFRNTNGLLAVANTEGQFLRANRAWTEVAGWTSEELQAHRALDFVHPDDQERTRAELLALVAGRRHTVGFRNRFRTRSGGYVELAWSATADLELGVVYAVATDLTKEVAQRDQLQRLATIAARTTNSVLVSDTQGRLEWVNQAFTEMTGYSLDEVQGHTPGQLLHGPATDQQTVAGMRECIRRGEQVVVEVLNYRKDGSTFWNSLEVQALHDPDGRHLGFMGIGTDITERRRAQAALVQQRDRAEQLARDAQAATEAKGQFLAMMSHELRTPLNGILGSAQLLLDGSLAPEHHALLQTLHDAGQGLLSLLNDLLDYSKLDSGKFGLDPRPLGLERMARGCVSLFSAEAQRLGLSLELVLGPGLPARVMGDELRLRQVLTNLLGNAMKFTERGHVRLSVHGTTDGRVRFAVDDTGIGIKDVDQQRLFAPFTQVDSSTRRRAGGTGLGLSISQHLVRLMGGTIAVRSALGEGSSFWFEVPLTEVAAAPVLPPPTLPAQPAPEGEVLVLLVEDNPINGLVGTKLLERVGCRVVLAKHGREALTAVEAQTFDLVLMDCHMPEMDGWEATRELRRRELRSRVGQRLPIVAQTASCLPKEVERCLAAGMDEVMAKPLDLLRLRSVVQRWATGKPEARAAAVG